MPRKSAASDDLSRLLTADSDGVALTKPPAVSNRTPTHPNMATASETQSPARARTQKSGAEKSSRKSTTGGEGDEVGGTEKAKPKKGKAKGDDMTIDDLLLPRSLISRLSRGSLPPNTSLQKDALLALTKSATVFISYLAHTSNSMTSRKTIQAADVLEAIREMELESVMGGRLEGEIKLFDEGVKGKRKGYRDRVKARESTGAAEGKAEGEGDIDADEGRGHERKRMKRDNDSDNDNNNSDRHQDLDVDMNGNTTSTSHSRDEDDDPSAQLIAEAVRAGVPVRTDRAGDNDRTNETDHDVVADEDEDDDDDDDQEEDDDEEEEDEDDEDEEDEENIDDDEDDEEETEPPLVDESRDMDREEIARRKAGMLAPNGRVEGDSDDEDSD